MTAFKLFWMSLFILYCHYFHRSLQDWHSAMAKQPAAEIKLLKSLKVKLIEILSSDADYILQHADSRSLLSNSAYQHAKACRVPREKVTELLDHIILKGPEAAQELLELLKAPDLQETFPRLDFIKDQVNTLSGGTTRAQRTGKRAHTPESQEPITTKKIKGQSHYTQSLFLLKMALPFIAHPLSAYVLLRRFSFSNREAVDDCHQSHWQILARDWQNVPGHALCDAGADRGGPLYPQGACVRHVKILAEESEGQRHSCSPALPPQWGRVGTACRKPRGSLRDSLVPVEL